MIVSNVFTKPADVLQEAWWIILLAGIALFVLMLLIVVFKNKRIARLKRQLKATRTELEVFRAQITSNRAQTAAHETEEIEFDDEEEEEVDDTEETSRTVDYYNKTSVVGQKGGTVKFTVVYDRPKDSWVIRKAGVDRVVRRVDTKEEAMRLARALCKKYDANLVVHKKDGKFQKS